MKHQKVQGLLITIEGVTGVGKSYFSEKLYNELNQNGSIHVKRMGGFLKDSENELPEITKFLIQLMKVNRYIGLPWLCETTLLVAEQAYNVETRVLKSYRDGYHILYENYNDALIAYQLMRGNSLGIEKDTLLKILTDLVELQYDPFKFPKPDYTIYLSAPLDLIYNRLEKRESREVSVADKRMIENIIENYEKLYKDRSDIIRIVNDSETDIDEEVKGLIMSITSKNNHDDK